MSMLWLQLFWLSFPNDEDSGVYEDSGVNDSHGRVTRTMQLPRKKPPRE